MAKKNNTYWKERFALLEEARHKKASRVVYDIDDQFNIAQSRIETQIRAWIQRFADGEGITLQEARKRLDRGELAEFKWNIQDYINKGSENAITQEWNRELENASARIHISRLESLKVQVQQEIERSFGNELDTIDKFVREQYKSTYYKSAFEIQKGTGAGKHLLAVDEHKLDSIIRKPWTVDGKTFSDRIWQNKQKLVNEVHKELTQMTLLGDSPDRAINGIAKKMNVSKNQAGALVMTESAFFATGAEKQCYNDLGIEKYKIVATLDTVTSNICRELDNKVFPMSEFKAGETAPPFHVHCRTDTVPYFEDELSVRAARDVDGNTYYVPSNMSYKEWYEEYVVPDPKYIAQEKAKKNRWADKEQFERYKEILGKDAPKSFDKFKDLKYNDSERWNSLKTLYRKNNYYNKVVQSEPAITKDLIEVSKKTGVDMVGLDYKLKTKESFLRKVNSDSSRSTDASVVKDALENTNDIIRYTYQAKPNLMVDSYRNINKELNAKGYSQVKCKNFWLDKHNPYNGVNAIYRTPEGQKFEIQFHTPDSFSVKNGKMHELYEKIRADVTTKDERTEITREMFKLSQELERPDNIKDI